MMFIYFCGHQTQIVIHLPVNMSMTIRLTFEFSIHANFILNIEYNCNITHMKIVDYMVGEVCVCARVMHDHDKN